MKINKSWYVLAAILINQSYSSVAIAMDQDAIIQRLDALERENSTLKERLSRVEHTASKSKISPTEQNVTKNDTSQRSAKRAIAPNQDPILDSPSVAVVASNNFAQDNPSLAAYSTRHFELSGSLLVLQPSTNNMTYGQVASPFPVLSPNWNDQVIQPNYEPTFNIGFRYMPNQSNDVDVNWTHLNSSTIANKSVIPATQFVAPTYFAGPQGSSYGSAKGYGSFSYDSIHIEVGHTFCAECSFQFRPFGGVEYASINNNLSGTFSNVGGAELHNNGLNMHSNISSSIFNGIGPRAGIKTAYNWSDFQLISKLGAGLLVGTQHNNFSTVTTCTNGCGGAPDSSTIGIVGNVQNWNAPSTTQVVPTVDTKLAVAHAFTPTNYGQFKLELGYQATVYFNANTQNELTNVLPNLNTFATTGIYLATASHTQNNFFVQGPYISGKWAY